MRKKWQLPLFYLIVFLTFLTFKSYQNRVYDWDMPGYIGTLYEIQFASESKIHQLTYRDIQREASPVQFRDISGLLYPSKAIQFFRKDSQAFAEQLPYYQIKVGYNFFVSIFYELGFSAPMSVLLVSIISFFLCGLILFRLLKFIFPENPLLVSALATMILILPPFWEMSTFPTPDMLVVLFILLFITALLKNFNRWILFYLLLFAVLVRTDFIVFALTYLMTVLFFDYFNHKKFHYSLIVQSVILLAVYFFVTKYFSYPGWKDVFYDTFIERRPLISAKAATFSFTEYLQIVGKKLWMFKKVTLTAVTMLAFIFYISKDSRIRIFSLLIFINLYLKFLVFPQSAVLRFFVPYILMLFIMFLYAASRNPDRLKLKKLPKFVP